MHRTFGQRDRLCSISAASGRNEAACPLTLPSRGHPTSGFADCRLPLMSNVRFPAMNKSEEAWAALSKRERAWVLLSDLFLDTTHTETELVRIANALEHLKFSVKELGYILRK